MSTKDETRAAEMLGAHAKETTMTHQRTVSEEERKKSLQDLDGRDLGDGSYFPSHVVLTCHALRRKPLREFTIEDLRLMIAQRQSLVYLIPLAIERLEQNPLVAGDFYESDLPASVLRVPPGFWRDHRDWRQAVQEIVARIDPIPRELREVVRQFRQHAREGENA